MTMKLLGAVVALVLLVLLLTLLLSRRHGRDRAEALRFAAALRLKTPLYGAIQRGGRPPDRKGDGGDRS